MSACKVKRPLLRYFGGKWQLRHWITGHFPDHNFYAEPFCGAASILLAKSPASGGEIINDLNEDVITLFRVMRDATEFKELKRRLQWTPYALAELTLSREPTEDPVERARRMIVRSFMGIGLAGTKGSKTGFRMGNVDLRRLDQDGKRTFRNCAIDWSNWQNAIDAIRDRLAKVMIYQRDALDFIKLMGAPDCLIYVDPPYHPDTRSSKQSGSRYAVEFTREQHCALIKQLISCPAKIILSGYRHPDYALLEKEGWSFAQKDYRANMSARRRIECLWMNFKPSKERMPNGGH